MKTMQIILASLLLMLAHPAVAAYPVAPTGQLACYDTSGREMQCLASGVALGGQDAAMEKSSLSYRDNGDGTVNDLITGLVWQKSPGAKVTWNEAVSGARTLRLGNSDDWRLPTIKELYSIMDFSGATPMPAGPGGYGGNQGKPFLDTAYFDFRYGDVTAGERIIDAQFWSATEYTGYTMNGNDTVFGVNFADGRIKGYPKSLSGRGENRMFVRYVRGNPEYGHNDFISNYDGTVTDRATGLMWMQADSGYFNAGPNRDGRMDWAQALTWAGQVKVAGYSDWRLPNAKELQSIVDYTRSPQYTSSAAIAPVFQTSTLLDESWRSNYPFYWSSTTHLDGPRGGNKAVYVAFGEALGYMRMPWGGLPVLMDVHGAGAQRSDPKQGNPAAFPFGFGPQGDIVRIYNFVRLVRDVE